MTERERRYSDAIDVLYGLVDDAPSNDILPDIYGAIMHARRAMSREAVGPDAKEAHA